MLFRSVVKTLPSNAGGASSIPGWGAKILHASQPKNQSIRQEQYCKNSIRTLKMVHIKKSLRNKNGREKINSMPMMQVNFCCCCSVTKSCRTLLFCDPMVCRLLCPWDFPGKSTGMGCHFLLQGIFPTQGSNPCLLH